MLILPKQKQVFEMETDFISLKLHYSEQTSVKIQASKNVKSRYLNNYFKIYVSIIRNKHYYREEKIDRELY